jgi:RNA 2',3'-cyclic 3'-phosphodiesterase
MRVVWWAMRLFVGIALGEAATATLRDVCKRFAAAGGDAVRWQAESTWHVTLQFLGEASEEQEVCVVERLRRIEAEPVPVRIAGLGFFERAGIFFADVVVTAKLLLVLHKVMPAMLECGFMPEARAYHPHITLAKAKGRNARGMAPLQKAVDRARFPLAADFVAAEFLLYESFPGPEGSRYEVRERFMLARG